MIKRFCDNCDKEMTNEEISASYTIISRTCKNDNVNIDVKIRGIDDCCKLCITKLLQLGLENMKF